MKPGWLGDTVVIEEEPNGHQMKEQCGKFRSHVLKDNKICASVSQNKMLFMVNKISIQKFTDRMHSKTWAIEKKINRQ